MRPRKSKTEWNAEALYCVQTAKAGTLGNFSNDPATFRTYCEMQARFARADGCALASGAIQLAADIMDRSAALRECVTSEGAHCLAYGTDTPKLRARLEAINATVRAVLP